MSRFAFLLVLALAGAAAAADLVCPSCKTPGDEGWKFCPYDGAKLVAEAPAPAPVPAAPPAPSPTAQPARPAPAPRDALDASHANPWDTVEDLFRAIAAGDARWIRRLYRWESFFAAQEAAPERLDAQIEDYIDRLVARVRPTLAGRDRFPRDIKLTSDTAEIRAELRDPKTKGTPTAYDFKLTRREDGWKIVGIRP